MTPDYNTYYYLAGFVIMVFAIFLLGFLILANKK